MVTFEITHILLKNWCTALQMDRSKIFILSEFTCSKFLQKLVYVAHFIFLSEIVKYMPDEQTHLLNKFHTALVICLDLLLGIQFSTKRVKWTLTNNRSFKLRFPYSLYWWLLMCACYIKSGQVFIYNNSGWHGLKFWLIIIL